MLLQQEWQFSQRVTPGVEDLFASLEEQLREDFLPSLSGGSRYEVTKYLRRRLIWGVKRAGIGIPDPTYTAPANFDKSENWCDVLT